MTCEEIYGKLSTLDIPVAYSHFGKPPSVPFVVYITSGGERYGADYKNMLERRTVRIELYTDKKDETLENSVAALFDMYELDIYESYIDNQKLYQVVFEFTDLFKTGG